MPRSEFVAGEEGNCVHIADWGGDGSPMLLLHGMGGHTHWWDYAAPLLTERHRVVAMDFRGHGDSDWTDPPRYQIEDYAADIETVRRRFGWERFYLVGHSMGARACVHYAGRFPERVERVAVLDFLAAVQKRSHEKYERKMKRRQPSYADREAMIANYHLQPRGTTLSEEGLRTLAGQSIRRQENGRWSWKFDWRCFFFEYAPIWDDASLIQAPCLVVRGEHSAVMTREDLRRIVDALADGAGLEIPRGYHHIPLDAPDEVARSLLGFGRGLPPGLYGKKL